MRTVNVCALVVAGFSLTTCSKLEPGGLFPPPVVDAELEAGAGPDAAETGAPSDARPADTIGADDGALRADVLGDTNDDPLDGSVDSSDGTDVTTECGDADCLCRPDGAAAGFGSWYLLPPLTLATGATVAGVASAADTLALYVVSGTGQVLSTRATAPVASGAWANWSPLSSAAAPLPQGTTVTPLARGGGVVDVFAVQTGGAIGVLPGLSPDAWITVGTGGPAFTSQRVAAATVRDAADVHVCAIAAGSIWQSDSDGISAGFSAWTAIAGAATFPSTSVVTAFSRDSSTLDVFAVSSGDQRIYDVAEVYPTADAGPRAAQPIGDPINTFLPATRVSAISRIPFQVDLFATAGDGHVWSNFRNANQYGGAWYGWFGLPSVRAVSQPVALGDPAQARADVFVIDDAGEVVTTSYDPAVAQAWSAWLPVGPGCARPTGVTGVTALSGAGVDEVVAIDGSGVLWAADRPTAP